MKSPSMPPPDAHRNRLPFGASISWDDAHFRPLVERSRDLICLHEPDGRYRYVSPSALPMLGYRPESLVGANPYDYFHPEQDVELLRRSHERVLAGRIDDTVRYRFRHADGRYIWLETLAVPLFEDAADPLRLTAMLTSSRDVGTQVESEALRVASDERLRLALLATGTGVFDVRLPGQTGWFSDQYALIFGYEAEDLPLFAAGWQPLVHESDLPVFLAARRGVMSGATTGYRLEVRRLHRDGQYRWMSVMAHVAEADAAGLPLRVVGTLQDVDERVRSSNALQESQRRLVQSQQLARLGDWRSDSKDPRERWSDEVYRILGLDPATTVPTFDAFIALVHPDDREIVIKGDAAVLRNGSGYEYDLRIIRPDGVLRHVYNRTAALRNGAGDVVGLFGTMQDITERKQVEAALREARDQVRELSGHLEDQLNLERKRIALDVHDELGQMLTAMKLQLDVLQSQLANPEQTRRTSERMRELIEETMEVTRNVALNLRPPALDLGLAAALEWLAEDFGLRTDIVCRVEAPVADLTLDDQQATSLLRIAQESLTNVARHARARQVHISFTQQGAGLQLAIHDDGVGFDAGASPPAGHFGLLGMRERALRLGAELEIDSRHGAGCTVRVCLPARMQAVLDAGAAA